MLKKGLILILVIGFTFSCSNPKQDEKSVMIEAIGELEKKCFNSISNSYDHKVALKVLVEYQKFIEQYPNDSVSAHYLYTSAQLSKSINLYGEALRKYEVFAKEYPDHQNVSKAKFMIGMIYENDIKDTIKAKAAYQTFITEFPTDDLVDDAQFLIQNLSLSDDELIKMLESKNKNDSII